MEKAIEVTGLKKGYREIKAVKGIDFYVEKGSLFAFLGPNGAGKTTTLDVLCTLIKPDAGEIFVGGRPLGDGQAVRRKIGVVFQDSLLDSLLTVRENMMIRGGFYGIGGRALKHAIARAAAASGTSDILGRPYGKLSGGQRRRADIARALIHTPEILFLDEPTTGLDPQTRKSVWDTIRRLQRENGVTVFLTTHYMEEAAKADYVYIIDEGRIAAKGTPQKLREAYSADRLTITPADEAGLAGLLKGMGVPFKREGGQMHISLSKTADAIPILDKCRGHIAGFEVTAGSMDDAFIAITGKELRE